LYSYHVGRKYRSPWKPWVDQQGST
jgi:hypothetical protein